MFPGPAKDGMTLVRKMEFFMYHASTHLQPLPAMRKESAQIIKVDDDFIAVDHIERLVIAKVLPVCHFERSVYPIAPGPLLRRRDLLGGNRNSDPAHTVSFAQVGEWTAPTAAYIQNTHPWLQIHLLGEQIQLGFLGLGRGCIFVRPKDARINIPLAAREVIVEARVLLIVIGRAVRFFRLFVRLVHLVFCWYISVNHAGSPLTH